MPSQPYGQMNPGYASNGTPYSGKPGSYQPVSQQNPNYGQQQPRATNAPPYSAQSSYMYQRQPGPGYNQMFSQQPNYPVSRQTLLKLSFQLLFPWNVFSRGKSYRNFYLTFNTPFSMSD